VQFDTGAIFQNNVDINGDSAGLTGFVKAGTGFQNDRAVLYVGWAYVQATPAVYPKTGYYPTAMRVGWDESMKAYVIALEGFKQFKAPAAAAK